MDLALELPPLQGKPRISFRSLSSATPLSSTQQRVCVDSDPAMCQVQQGSASMTSRSGCINFEEQRLSDAVEALSVVEQRGSAVDAFHLYRLLKRCSCGIEKNLSLGRRVHSLAVRSGYGSNLFLANHIICMYASFGELREAMQVFTKVAAPDTHIWTSIILGHARNGHPVEALELYRQMRNSAVKPDNHVFVAILKACASAGDLGLGREIHAEIMGSSDECNVFVNNCLVHMYAKCGSLQDARSVFDTLLVKDVVTWNAMISGYVRQGMGQVALDLYAGMQKQAATSPTRVTYAYILRACASVGDIQVGKEVHSQIRQRRLEQDVVVGSCLVDMYAKCGYLEDGRRVFDRLPQKDLVIWTSMIGGYVQQGLGQEALILYADMQKTSTTLADGVTFACLLKACGSVGALCQGKELHAQIEERGLDGYMVPGNSLIDMYAKCGRLADARRVFNRLTEKDVVTWTTLLNGYAQHGDGQMAVQSFKEMQRQGVEPNGTTFTCLLVACSHEGLVYEGQQYFQAMVEDFGIMPTAAHYTCMVDLLGRSGHLDEAEKMLECMPPENAVVGWTSLLSACKSHGDAERGRRCFHRLCSLEPECSSAYVLLASIYASKGRWVDVDRIESLRKRAGSKKKPAKALVEVRKTVYEFTVGEGRADISAKLSSMNVRFKNEGHVPHTELVLKAQSDAEKQVSLCGHAEKLALAYGLLNTADGTPLLVTKNLRMCNDCHSATKIMSRLENRNIVVRDSHRVHCFANGSCSCGDRH